jgi:hypothetical protein
MRSSLVPLLLAVLALPARAADLVAVDLVPPPTGAWHPMDLVEVKVALDRTYADPYDPGVVAVTATLENGLDEHFFEGFWFQDYDVANVDGLEHLVETGEPTFLVRLRAPSPGHWRLWVRATDADGEDALDVPFDVDVAEPSGPPRGFVHRVTGTPRLAWDDGTPYVPFGANVCWAATLADFAHYFDRLAENGLTWTRVWMTHFDGTALEWSSGDDGGYQGLGRFNPKAAWRVDRILRLAEERGIALQLVLQQHSQFECANWSSWDTNPWSAANGGPIVTSGEFFTNPEVVAGFDRKVHYLVARYAHSPALLAWELFNEIELISGAKKADLEAWMHDRAQLLKGLDPYRHPVTTSYSAPCWTGCSQPWGDDAFDLTQVHSYLPDYWMSLSRAADQMRTYGKPAIAGEVGIDFLGEKNLLDPEGIELVNMTLVTAMSGFAGGAMSWWWDNWLEPNDLWAVLGTTARAVQLAGLDRWLAPIDDAALAADHPGVMAADVEGAVVVWVHDPDSEWNGEWVGPFSATARVELPVDRTCDGPWQVTLLDPRAPESSQVVEVPAGAFVYDTPSFVRDLLLRVECPEAPVDEASAEPVPDDLSPGEASPDEAPLEPPDGESDADLRSSGGCAVGSFR